MHKCVILSLQKKCWLLLFGCISLTLINSNANGQITLTSRATGNWNEVNTWISGTLTGTITTSTANATVTGVGTSFTTELSVGAVLYRTDGTTSIGTVQTINSNTSITLTASASNNNTNASFRTRKIPESDDAVIINSGFDVTILASTNAVCSTLDVGVTNTSSTETLIFSANTSTLTTTGNVTVFGNTTNNTKEITLGAGVIIVGGDLIIGAGGQNGGGQANRLSRMTVSTGTANINGDLILTATAAAQAAIVFSGAGTINLDGDFTLTNAQGTLTPSTSTFNCTGGNQSITGASAVKYNNFTATGTGTKTLSSNVSVGAALTVDAGVTLALSTFTLSTPTSVTLEGGASGTGATISGSGTLTIGGNVTVNDNGGGTNGATISCPLALGAATRTFSVADDGSTAVDLTVSGVISGATGITKTGAGTMDLSAANTYTSATSATTVTAGILRASSNVIASTAGAFGNSASAAANIVLNGGKIETNTATFSKTITVTTTASSLDAFGSARTISGTITRNAAGTVTLNVGGTTVSNEEGQDLTLSGTISNTTGTLAITKTGTSTVIISGASNSYSGATTISAGELRIDANVAATGNGALGNGGAINLAGGTLLTNTTTFARAITVTVTNSTVDAYGSARTISSNINLATAGTFNLNVGGTTVTNAEGQELTLSGVISNASGTLGLTKIGSSTVILSTSTNTYTGAVAVNAGVLSVRNAASTGTTAGGVSVASGAALEIQGGITVGAEALSLTGDGISSAGALRNVSGTNTWGGTVTLSTSAVRINSDAGILTLNATNALTATNIGLTVGGAGNTTVSGTITTGTGSLTKEGAGTLTLAGGSANTYSGLTTISNGTLSLGSTAASTNKIAGNISISGGTLNYSTANDDQIANSSTITLSSGTFDPAARTETIGALTMTGGALTKGGGVLTLSNASSITGGTLTFSATTSSLATSSSLALGGATFNYTNASNATANTLALGGDVSYAATGTAPAIFANTLAGIGQMQIGSGVTRTFNITQASPSLGQAEVQIGWIVSQGVSNAALTKSGTGTLVLSAANSYAGLTTISGGILNAQNALATGTTAGGVTVSSGGSLQLDGGIAVGAEALTLNGDGVSCCSSGALLNGSGSNSWGGAITLGSNSRINSNSGTLTLSNTIDLASNTLILQGTSTNSNTASGSISGTGGIITKSGVGTWILSGANSFTGGVNLHNGTLHINNASALGTTAGTFSIGGAGNAVTIDNTSGGAITTLNYPITWADNLTFVGSSNLNLGAGTLSMSANKQATISSNTLTIGGAISASAYNITKAGTGTLSFGSNTVSLNSLSINAGTLTSTSGTLNLAGNLVNTGTFTHNSGTVNFNGTVAQSTNGSAIAFYNLTNANTSASITSGANVTVGNLLTINTSTVLDMATYQLLDGASLTNSNAGKIRTANTSSTPIPGGKTWTSHIEYYGASQSVRNGTYTDLTIAQSSGTASLTGTSSVTGVLTLSGGDFDLNGQNLTLSGTDNISTVGAARTISSGTASTLSIPGNRTVTSASGGNLIIGTNVTADITAAFNPGSSLTTVNGKLQLSSGGSLNTNSVIYGSGSTLIYNQGGTPSLGLEWTANTATAGLGNPHHITIQNGSTISLPSSDKGLAGDMNINNGTLNLNATSGDLYVGGGWTRTSSGTFNHNNRKVIFNGTVKSIITAPSSTTRNTYGGFGGEIFYKAAINKTNTSDTVRLASNITIINQIEFTKGAFDCNKGDVTLVSYKSGTANVAAITNTSNVSINYTDTGKFIIQRHLPIEPWSSSRRWRLMAAPVSSSSTNDITINRAWQNGSKNASLNSPVNPQPGYGTTITNGNTAGAVANGFDLGNTASPSIYYMSPGPSPTWVAPSSTYVPITSHEGYMLFVRGHRGVTISNQFATPDSTTLEPKGRLNIGDVTKSIVAGVQVIGNPYASAISFNNVTYNGINPGTIDGIGLTYYLWDPKSPGAYNVGQWITFSSNGDGTYTYSPTPVSSFSDEGIIESGAAFVINSDNPGTLVIHETDKVTSSSTIGIASKPGKRPTAISAPKLSINMYLKNNDGTTSLMDGVTTLYSDGFRDIVDGQDALKISTFTSKERVGLVRTNSMLSIERRKTYDTSFLTINKLNTDNHQFEFIPENWNISNEIILEDKFKNTYVIVDPTTKTYYDFNTNGVPAASDTSRFRIYFRTSSTLPVRISSVNAGLSNNSITVNWKVETETNVKSYEVERSTDGTHFSKLSSINNIANNGNVATYSVLDNNVVSNDNYYRIKIITQSGSVVYSQVVKVRMNNTTSGISIFPNPIKNNTLNIQLNNMTKGTYAVKVNSAKGQNVYSYNMNISSTNQTESVVIPGVISKGVYFVEFISPENEKTIKQISVQ